MKRIVSIVCLLLILVACGHDNDRPGKGPKPTDTETPSTGGEDTEIDYDFSPELEDATSRIESEALTLRYGDAGILVSQGNGVDYELRDISTGHYASFKAAGEIGMGSLSDSELEIDGAAVAISKASIEYVDNRGVWIHITTLRNEHIVLVVTDL